MAAGDIKYARLTGGGSTTQIQFNDGGMRAGASNLTWNKTSSRITLTVIHILIIN